MIKNLGNVKDIFSNYARDTLAGGLEPLQDTTQELHALCQFDAERVVARLDRAVAHVEGLIAQHKEGSKPRLRKLFAG